MNKFSLKEYKTLLAKKQAERDTIVKEVAAIQVKLGQINKEIKALERTTYDMVQKGVEPITEHALLRYLEHVKGIDMEATKLEILGHVGELANVSYEIKGSIGENKFKFVVKDRQVITVVKL